MPRPTPPPLTVVAGEPSWRFASDRVEAFITRDGGHLAPVTFDTPAGPIQPYAIAPWCAETPNPAAAPGTDRVLRMLRGDFFCAPFGGGEPWNGERHPAHGEPATARWTSPALHAGADGVTEFSASLKTRVRPGRLVKRLRLRAGETNLYSRHEFHGYTGPMNFGHHATLAFPPRARLRPHRPLAVEPRPRFPWGVREPGPWRLLRAQARRVLPRPPPRAARRRRLRRPHALSGPRGL